ncbi:MAG: hypothetical protein CL930_11465 [Deltaproteobacteria bacterium]|nr:hypothetical protein [Deltaproteobacteria bacterium]
MEVADILSIGVVILVILLVLLPAIHRMLDLVKIPLLAWPVMLMAGLMPSFMAYTVLNPGTVYDKAEVRGDDDKFELDIPTDGDYAVMITAMLGEEDEDRPTDKTAFTIRYERGGDEFTIAETIRRKSGDDAIDVEMEQGETVRERGKLRSGTIGEKLQYREDIKGEGAKLRGEVTNWQGEAAQVLFIEVVKAPPKQSLLWIIALGICALAILTEAKFGADKFTGDIGFLTMYGVFLRDGVTPLDTYQGVGMAVLPAAIVGFFGVAGIGFLVTKATRSKAKAE